MTPKVNFHYSGVYDRNCREWMKIHPRWARKEYSSEKEVLSYFKKVEKIWRKNENRILKELSNTE